MRVARFSEPGSDPRYGLVELAADSGSYPDTVSVLTGDPLVGSVKLTGERRPLSEIRLLAPVIPRSKIIGVGRNYAEHAAELGRSLPESPLTFFKPNTAVIGPESPIICPLTSDHISFEGELAVVIGRIGRSVPAAQAQDLIFGYTIANDVTARDLQDRDGQWTRAKGYDTFCPLGPWIVTHMPIAEAGELGLQTTITTGAGERIAQNGNTNQMINNIASIIEFITSYTTVLPGDVILTGTPAGVGRLNPGDRVTVRITGIGELSNPVIGESE